MARRAQAVESEPESAPAPATSEEITIAGQTFTVPSPYAEGHTLNAGEASALNQVLHENVRNNMAKRIKSGGTQTDVDEYIRTYQFGVRTGGGGRVGDPVRREEIVLAKQAVVRALRAKGKNIKDYSAKQLTEAAEKAAASNPKFRELAERRVAESRELADVTFSEEVGEAA